ncbi:hypothetical protein M3N55_05695 [Roseibaca sp. V10]|uniref:GIY-YIG domain-containing protein n=1 Tax=Roseinatronobacter domitianus TaxID=2940293 RepID=A0ABT0M018_9RHOB|nr:hypothetical protein [Roseibaca domitiana]MCL1628217.1 hypothetical protein [Roseibaca domitiana]
MRNLTRAFRAGVHGELGCYVYRLVDPVSGNTFYVGRGVGNRIFEHLSEAETSTESRKTNKIRAIWASGNDVSLIVHRHGLTEAEASLVESSLIDFINDDAKVDAEEKTNKIKGYKARELGKKSVEAINHQYAALAAELDRPIALIKINRKWVEHHKNETNNGKQPSLDQMYEMVRGHWVVNPKRHTRVKYIAAVAFGLIREVYRIESWSEPDKNKRVAFTGAVADELSHYKGTHVNDVYQRGAQAPVRWYYPKASV